MKRKTLSILVLSIILTFSLVAFCACESSSSNESSSSSASSASSSSVEENSSNSNGNENSGSQSTSEDSENSSSLDELPSTITQNGINFKLLDNNTYEVWYPVTPVDNVIIPETINGAKVTSISVEAFKNRSWLESIEIPNSVTNIGFEAFSGCSSLTKVNYWGSVDEWVQISFYPTSNPTIYAKDLHIKGELLTHAEITLAPEINGFVFQNCQSLKTVEISKSVISIGRQAFENCSSLQSVTFEKESRLETIGYSAFYDCCSLETIEIPNSVTEIDFSVFYGCELLESVTFEEGSCLETIGSRTFSNCSSLQSIKIPYSVTSIGQGLFNNCNSLKSVSFENKSGWWITFDTLATSGKTISASDLSNLATAAQYLTSTYSSYYWKRS